MRTRSNLAVACLATLVACNSSHETSDSGTSLDASTPPGELCNGIDDTNDGVIDEGCPCTSFDINVPGSLWMAKILWIGDRYLVATNDDPTLTFTPIVDGVPGASWDVGPIVFNVSFFNHYRAAWSGSTLAVLRMTPSAFELTVHTADGTLLQAQTLSTDTRWSELAWVGDRFIIAGRAAFSAPNAVSFAEFARDGTPMGAPYGAGPSGGFYTVEGFAASPSTLVVAVSNPTGVFAFDRSTQTSAFHQFIDLPGSAGSVLVYGHDEFVFVKPGGPFGGDALQILDAAGGLKYPMGALVWQSYADDVVSTEEGFAAFALYGDSRAPNDKLYLYARLDLRGDPIAPPVWPLVTQPSSNGSTAIVGAVAHGRTGLAGGYARQAVRVIQLCNLN